MTATFITHSKTSANSLIDGEDPHELSAATEEMARRRNPNFLTIITARRNNAGEQPFLAKQYSADGKSTYALVPKHFSSAPADVSTDAKILELVVRLGADPHSAVILGALLPDADPQNHLRRKEEHDGEPATYEDVPRSVYLLDIDKVLAPEGFDRTDIEAAATYARSQLPEALRNVRMTMVASSSYGMSREGKPDRLNFRAWVRLSRPLLPAEMKAWVQSIGGEATLDVAVFNSIQISYTSDPIFDDPGHDPLPHARVVVLDGEPAASVPGVIEAPARCRITAEDSGRYQDLWDDFEAIDAARRYLKTAPRGVSVHGKSSRRKTVLKTFYMLLDYGCTPETAVGLMMAEGYAAECSPPYKDRAELEKAVDDGAKYRGSAIGCRHPRAREIDEAVDPQSDSSKIDIIVRTGELAACADDVEQHLTSERTGLYLRGSGDGQSFLCEPGWCPEREFGGGTNAVAGLLPVNEARLSDVLSRHFRFLRRAGADKYVPVNIPPQLVKALMARPLHQLKVISGVITSPTLRHDGEVLREPGYDEATGLYYFAPEGLDISALPERPTRDDAEAALGLLRGLLEEFPFKDRADHEGAGVDEAVALSAMLTTVARGVMPVAPAHLFSGADFGSGKSYLAEIVSHIATGQAAVTTSIGNKEEETEKRIDAFLRGGSSLCTFDNVNGVISGDKLCMLVSQWAISIRLLGTSNMLKVRNFSTLLMTGKNPMLKEDMVRRTMATYLDPNVENPELRKFAKSPVAEIKKRRGDYVAACLTIVRAYALGERPGVLPRLGGFEHWSDNVRSALVWLGCADPVASLERGREGDVTVTQLLDVMAGVKAYVGVNYPFSIKLLIRMALGKEFLTEALESVAEGRGGGIDASRLGVWFRKNKNVVKGGYKFTSEKGREGAASWRLVKADAPATREKATGVVPGDEGGSAATF